MIIQSKNVQLKNGQQIALRSPRPDEAEKLLKHLQISHSESYRNLNQTPQYWKGFSAEDEGKILADFETSKSKFMLSAFNGDSIVGGLGFVGSIGDFLKHNARIGMSIQNAFCNTGLGTEMIRYSLDLGKQHGFHRVELTVRTYNDAGIALYEKTGFQRVGLLKAAAFIDNEYVDEYLYQIILK